MIDENLTKTEQPINQESTPEDEASKIAEADEVRKRDSSLDESQSKRLKSDCELIENKYETMQPRLKKFLKIYQLSSRNSLSGPNQSDIEMSLQSKSLETNNLNMIANVAAAAAEAEVAATVEVENETENEEKKNLEILEKNEKPKKMLKEKHSNAQKQSNLKYLKCIQADQDTSQLMETLLHGERISCFIVGGEKRLCLHDILNTILKDFSVQQINSACQKLSIACLESTPKQLEILKRNQLLPPGAPNCGLLTQTNSERLCAFLMDSTLSETVPIETPPSSTSSSPASLTPSTLKVFHQCFGKTYGNIHINMYSRHDSACIECDTCRKLYSPKNFVCHSHKNETSTRHWGFDSSNWRIYLKLANYSEEKNVLADVKISNKDNIAANGNKDTNELKDKEKMLLIQEEEFEMFKQKFMNIEQKLMSKCLPFPLNDWNNQMHKQKSEHKLLNGLLSKPMIETIPNAQQSSNQPNIVIQNSSINMDNLVKTVTPKGSKISSTKQNQNQANNNPMAYISLLNSKYFNKQNYCLNQFNQSHLNHYLQPSNSIDLSMLEAILNEIDLNIVNKDNSERLKQMIIQMHTYFNEKLNDQYYLKNKYINEFEEYKISLQNENDQLKCQLKLYQIQNELGKDAFMLKKTSPNMNHSQKTSNSSTSTSTSTSPISSVQSSHSSIGKNQAQTANTILQNILLLQNQQSNNNTLAQSFPFLLNHYNSGRTNLSSLLEPITSTPIKFNNSKYMNNTTTSSIIKNEQNSKTGSLNTQTSATA